MLLLSLKYKLDFFQSKQKSWRIWVNFQLSTLIEYVITHIYQIIIQREMHHIVLIEMYISVHFAVTKWNFYTPNT